MRTLTASERSTLIKLASNLPTGNPERRAILASLDKLSNITISEREYDSLKKGQRVEIEFGGAMSSGKATLEVGRTSYSKKYDVYTKTLYYIDKDTDKPITKNKVSFKLFKRLSYRGEKFDNPKISLAKGDMGVAIKSFRKV